ncbi:MAG: serine/threonine-protein kinase [Acidobacteria bacterium]|jgi:hypothetical protein|nr:serine/threonine-protein kinase [Acidobacteriota bacterium]
MASGAGSKRWGSFELLERIGGGPSGEVFRARPRGGGPVVALRLLPVGARTDSARTAAFVRQGEQLAAIEHPHLVRVLSAGVHDGRAGRAMELLDGISMAQFVEEQGPLAPQELVTVGSALCRALGALHAAGVVHGDLRARNVVRARGMRVVLADPGDEPPPLRGAAASAPLRAGAAAFFTAPERLRGDPPSAAGDLYALGALLHLLATGTLPVTAEDLLALRAAHERGGRLALSKQRRDLPPALAAAIDRALAYDPRARFADAAEMERALLGEPVAPPPAPPPVQPGRAAPAGPKPARRFPWSWMAVVLALAAGTAGVWPLLRGGPPEAPPPESAIAGAPAAAAAGAPALEARLFRSGLVRDEPLGPSSVVAAGDALYLMLAPAEDQYLVVLHRSGDGRLAALLPEMPGAAAERIAAGRRIRVPGSEGGRVGRWQAGAGGVELLAVLGSREPISLLDAALVGRTVENPFLLEDLAGRYFVDGDPPEGVTRHLFAVAVRGP